MNIGNITMDCTDPARLAAFWAAALGWEVEPASAAVDRVLADRPDLVGARAAVVHPSGRGTKLWFQRVSEVKQTKNRVHLDCTPGGRDRDAEVRRLVDLGATVVATVTEELAGFTGSHVVLADPEGNEFCLQ